MAKDLILDVVARKNSKDLSTLADEFDKLRKKVDDSGKSFNQTGSFSELLDKQLAATRAQVRDLGEEFDRTGNKDVFASLGGAQKNLASLERIKKQLSKALDDGAKDAAPKIGQDITGGKFSTSVRSGIESALKSLPKVPLDADAAPAERRLAELRVELEALGKEHIGVTIDEKSALASLVRIKAELLAIGGTKSSPLRIDTRSAAADLAGLGQVFKAVGVEGAKELGKAVDTGAQEGAKSFTSALQGVLSTPVLGPITVGALAAIIAAAAPGLGATLGAGIVTGGGLGLIGVGIASQLGSPTVKASLTDLKTQAKSTFVEAGSAFGPVLLDGIHKAESELTKIEPTIAKIESNLAPVADKLFGGVTGFVDKLGPGLESLSKAAGPVIGELANELPGLGNALSSMLKSVSAGGPGATVALHDLFLVIDATVAGAGKLIEVLEKTYGWLRVIGSAASGNMGEAYVQLQMLGQGQTNVTGTSDALSLAFAGVTKSVGDTAAVIPHTSDQFGALIAKLGDVTNTADTAAGAMSDKLFNSLMAGDQATLGWNESLTRLTDALKQNKDALDIKTAAGQADREAVLAAVQANIQQYDTNIAAGQSAQDAASAYDANTAALDRQLRKAGLTQGQIDSLIGKYAQVPDDVNTNIAIQGLTTAINDLSTLLKQINGIHDKTVTITYRQKTTTPGGGTGYTQYNAKGSVRHAAVGMVLPPTNPGVVLAAEPQTGGEVLTPLKGISKGRAMQLSRVAGDAYGFDVTPRGGIGTPATPSYGGVSRGGGGSASRPLNLNLNTAGANGLEALFATWFMNAVRTGLIQISAS